MLTGFSKRLIKEIKEVVPERMRSHVRIPSSMTFNRSYSTWIGGTILSPPRYNVDFYNEYGTSIIFRKCF